MPGSGITPGSAESLLMFGGYAYLGTSLLAGISSILTAHWQADIMEDLAEYNQIVTEIEIDRKEREFRGVLGAQRAQTAAAGISPDIGTPLDLQIEGEIFHEIDVELTRIAGGVRHLNQMTQAGFTRAGGWAEFGKWMGAGMGAIFDISLANSLRNPPGGGGSLLTTRPDFRTTTPGPWG